jgi:hypothetical protein
VLYDSRHRPSQPPHSPIEWHPLAPAAHKLQPTVRAVTLPADPRLVTATYISILNLYAVSARLAEQRVAKHPPVFILPRKTVKFNILRDCDVLDAAVTATPSGFVNMELFESWLVFFAADVPEDVKHPLILIMDGCSSHYSSSVFELAGKLQIMLVCPPANLTHLFQPLDVALLDAFKRRSSILVKRMQRVAPPSTIDSSKSVMHGIEVLPFRHQCDGGEYGNGGRRSYGNGDSDNGDNDSESGSSRKLDHLSYCATAAMLRGALDPRRR